MSSAVLTLWWIVLGLALLLTIVATARLMRVIHRCGQILELARRTVPAARGIAKHTAAIRDLSGVVQLAPTLLTVCGQLEQGARGIADTLDSVAPKLVERGDPAAPPNPRA